MPNVLLCVFKDSSYFWLPSMCGSARRPGMGRHAEPQAGGAPRWARSAEQRQPQRRLRTMRELCPDPWAAPPPQTRARWAGGTAWSPGQAAAGAGCARLWNSIGHSSHIAALVKVRIKPILCWSPQRRSCHGALTGTGAIRKCILCLAVWQPLQLANKPLPCLKNIPHT